MIHGWDPPFAFRTGYTPPRDIVATVAFTKADPVATQAAQQQARSQTRYVYVARSRAAGATSGQLRNTLVELTAAPTLDKLDPKIWQEFQAAAGRGSDAADGQGARGAVPQVPRGLHAAGIVGPRRQGARRGLRPLRGARPAGQAQRQELGRETRRKSSSIPSGHPEAATGGPRQRRVDRRRDGHPRRAAQAPAAFAPWPTGCSPGSQPRLKPTLTADDQLTKERMDKAEKAVGEVQAEYSVGQPLAKAGQPLDNEQLDLLRLEYAAAMQRAAARRRWSPAPPP